MRACGGVVAGGKGYVSSILALSVLLGHLLADTALKWPASTTIVCHTCHCIIVHVHTHKSKVLRSALYDVCSPVVHGHCNCRHIQVMVATLA